MFICVFVSVRDSETVMDVERLLVYLRLALCFQGQKLVLRTEAVFVVISLSPTEIDS